MTPSTAEEPPAPFLNGASGRRARPNPLVVEDEASVTDLQMEEKEEEHLDQIRSGLGFGLGLGLLTCAIGARRRRRQCPTRGITATRISLEGEWRRRDERGDELTWSQQEREERGSIRALSVGERTSRRGPAAAAGDRSRGG